MDFPLAVSCVLALVPSEADVPLDLLEDEDSDFLVADKEQSVLGLVEDEIILALPVAPRHEVCVLPGNDGVGGKILPFAALSALKKKK